jgi:hypothetical protein
MFSQEPGVGVKANTHETHALSGWRHGESMPGRWHRGLVKTHVFDSAGQISHSAPAQPHSLAGHGYALAAHAHALAAGATAGLGRLGGGGLGRLIVHLFIWRLIWRAGLGLWHIPRVGPFVVVLLVAAMVALVIVRKQRGPRWWRSNRGSSTGARDGRGPRDW